MSTPIEQRLLAAAGDESGCDRAVSGFLSRAEAEGLIEVAYCGYDAPVGPLLVAVTGAGLVGLDLHPSDAFAESLAREVSPRVVEFASPLDGIRRQLDEYFAGRRQVFDHPIDWQRSRGFRLAVRRRLYADVAFGQTVTYKQLAAMSGSPNAARAVGSAMATNPLPIVVPCHRVLDSAGRLHGYGGGLPMKAALLRLEGALA